MKAKDWEMTPYVYARETPDGGIAAFLDLPRYYSGYAALHNSISFMPETHMLKLYKGRVESTLAFMETMIQTMDKQHSILKQARKSADTQTINQTSFDLNWAMDREKVDAVIFKGYEAKYKKSEVTGMERLYYDRNAPYEKKIPYYGNYKATISVDKPVAYIIPQAYTDIIERLEWNGVQTSRLSADQTIEVEMYRIGEMDSRKQPYEGHYLHSNVQLTKEVKEWNYYKGDYIVMLNQVTNRYIMETLEPQGADSFFAWNFFDSILMQKEHFSPYVFEDLAADFLRKNPAIKAELEEKRKNDPEFAKNSYAQLQFVYEHTPHYEPTHRLYPIGRMMKEN